MRVRAAGRSAGREHGNRGDENGRDLSTRRGRGWPGAMGHRVNLRQTVRVPRHPKRPCHRRTPTRELTVYSVKLKVSRRSTVPLPYLLVTRRSADVRLDSLLRTACDVILARGLPNTRTADVAAAAGVSQALVFYHFETKDRLLAQAFAYAAEADLAGLDRVLASTLSPVAKLRRILTMYAPTGSSKAWAMWIDGWAESMRVPELESVSRRLDLRWKEGLTDVIGAGVQDATFTCDDPRGAAWRLIALMDGLAVAVTVHEKVISRRQLSEWVRIAAARELGLSVDDLG